LSFPEKLYKYLPSEHLTSTIKGEILFRNFTYFKQHEDKTRGDYLEAIHRDNPDNEITITAQKDGIPRKYDASFLNSTDSDLIFMFCTSLDFSPDLYKDFNCNACIEIIDPTELCRRIRVAVRRKISTHKNGLLSGAINYYRPNQPVEQNIKDAMALPFLKDEIYSGQNEFRLVFGVRKAFKLKQQIILNKGYDFREEAMKGSAKSRVVKIGSIEDIVIVHKDT
tara:strand:- start:33 stop:704 length:672 start_codon:yes stop_codon:yes gene_type:complete